MADDFPQQWFTEVFPQGGSAFSFKLTDKGKLHEEQTPFQNIEVYETETYGNLMVIDGCVMLTTRDNFLYHEMMSHPVLFTHPDPKKVLIIGGGDCGTLKEVLRHPGVESVTQVDIDEGVTRASEKYFPELCESNKDPRATLLFADGIQWVKDAADESLDVIIVDSTDPVGPAEGLFGEPYLRDCLRILSPGGLFCQQSESPLYHTELQCEMQRFMKRVGFDAVRTLPFPQPVYPSGWWSCTLASKGGSLDSFREADSRNKGFETRYYTVDTHKGALALPPFMQQAFDAD